MYSVIPINSRVAIVDTILPQGGGPGGKSPVFIRAGTTVQLYLYSMHRRKDLFGEDAHEFKPERWETMKSPG
jgi:cytochrome P450